MKNKITFYVLGIICILSIVFYLTNFTGEEKAILSNDPVPGENLSVETTVISFQGYFNEIKELPRIPTEEEWTKTLNSSGVFGERLKEDVKKYGDIAKRYYYSDDYQYLYIDIDEADVTGDGELEKIVSFDGGGTYGIDFYEIVKGDKIIATIKSESIGRGARLHPSETDNGFTMTWYTEDMFPEGYCCPSGRITTHFIYEDSEFIPVYEQMKQNKITEEKLTNKPNVVGKQPESSPKPSLFKRPINFFTSWLN